MIRSVGDAATEDVFQGANTKAARTIPKDLWAVVRRKLDMVSAARSLDSLRMPPGNRLEALKGDRAGLFSIPRERPVPHHIPVRGRGRRRRPL